MTLICLCLFSDALSAQTAGTTVFRAILLPGDEVPAVNTNARGLVDGAPLPRARAGGRNPTPSPAYPAA